jgi:hypothetical protein
MSEKPSKKPAAVYTAKFANVVCSVYLRTNNCGYSYHDFVLARTFTTRTERENKSETFFASCEADLIQAVQAAAAWIRENSNSTGTL